MNPLSSAAAGTRPAPACHAPAQDSAATPGQRAGLPWRVQRIASLGDFLARWQQLATPAPTPFHSAAWLRHWYATLGCQPGMEPLLLCARREGDKADALLLPLVRRRQGRLAIVEPPDRGVSDYNGPLLNPALTFDASCAAPLWQALKQALAGNDLLRIDKLLTHVGGQPNPLALALPCQPCNMFGNHFSIDGSFDDWRHSLAKEVRKEFERTWRVFSRIEGAHFVRASEPAQALNLYQQLEAMQHARLANTPGYQLDDAAHSALYAGLLQDGLQDGLQSGQVVLTALMHGDQAIAALYGLLEGGCYTMLRVSFAGDAWKHCAPGKLILERTIAHLHEQGCRQFDFAIGDYAHKRIFKTTPRPLLDACVALSWRGLPAMAAWRARHLVRRQPALVALAQRWRRR